MFVGFADGRIIKYNWNKDLLALGIEKNSINPALTQPVLAAQPEKVIFESPHKGRVSSIAYVPEVQEVFTSGADDMLMAFTPSGVPVMTTGKFKKSFDWITVIQRPKTFYEGSGFNILSAQKASISMKPFAKVNEPGTQRILKRHNLGTQRNGFGTAKTLGKRDPESQQSSEQPESELSPQELAHKVLGVVAKASWNKPGAGDKQTGGTGPVQEPAIQRRDRESAEQEVVELKQKLLRLLEINKALLARPGAAVN